MSHWKTLFDPDDGEPYGVVCHCSRTFDHDGNGNPFPNNPDRDCGEGPASAEDGASGDTLGRPEHHGAPRYEQ